MFSRVHEDDQVVVGIDMPKGKKTVDVSSVFNDGEIIRDYYSGQILNVENKNIILASEFDIVLLERFKVKSSLNINEGYKIPTH